MASKLRLANLAEAQHVVRCNEHVLERTAGVESWELNTDNARLIVYASNPRDVPKRLTLSDEGVYVPIIVRMARPGEAPLLDGAKMPDGCCAIV